MNPYQPPHAENDQETPEDNLPMRVVVVIVLLLWVMLSMIGIAYAAFAWTFFVGLINLLFSAWILAGILGELLDR